MGLTQQGMAGEVMSVAQYSRIESGEQRIKVEDLLELLESHNYDLGYFFTKMIYSRRGEKEADLINIEFRVKNAFYDWNWKKMSFLKEQAANLTGKTALRVGGDLVAYLLDPELKDHEQLKSEVSDYFFSLDNWMDDTEAIVVFAVAIQLMKFDIAYFWLSELLTSTNRSIIFPETSRKLWARLVSASASAAGKKALQRQQKRQLKF
ncbi:helix-turn-helix domain-containing protein [Lactobacillus delbrueckii]|uniref:helix-turn-helix domain-containing protein n=1 Tax=Lactobacillus delbrueckii TaxID=1584 RepID=UPI0021A77033|nr:helix-turn-helix transcriptional regulator [Lactobacillus delbrueckii]